MQSFYILNNLNDINLNAEFEGTVIFYKKNIDETIYATQQNLLQRIIENGLKLKMEQFLIIDVSTVKIRYADLQKKMNIKRCFLFGVAEKEIGLNFSVPNNKLITVASIHFVKSAAPEVFGIDKEMAKNLLIALQSSFLNNN